jgi:hypothetical protein
MLEILAIIGLSKKIGNIAFDKGLKKTPYIIIMIALWVVLEIVGAVIGTLIFGEETLMVYLCAVLGAATGALLGYLIVNSAASKRQVDGSVLDSHLTK